MDINSTVYIRRIDTAILEMPIMIAVPYIYWPPQAAMWYESQETWERDGGVEGRMGRRTHFEPVKRNLRLLVHSDRDLASHDIV